LCRKIHGKSGGTTSAVKSILKIAKNQKAGLTKRSQSAFRTFPYTFIRKLPVEPEGSQRLPEALVNSGRYRQKNFRNGKNND
jgi:hypothetical protein